MKFIRIESREQWEDYKKKLREWCAKANSEMTQEEMLEMMEKRGAGGKRILTTCDDA